MQQAVGCWSTEHCGAVLPGLVFLAVSHEFWLFKGKVQHWEGRHTTAPRSLQHSQFWVMGVSCSLRFQSEHLAVRSENPSLPCVRFITCNSYFMSLYYILLLFGVNLFSLPILIGLFLFSFPPPKKGGRKLKRSQGGLLPLPPLSCVKPQNFQHISALQFNILSLHIQSAFWKYGLQHCRSIKPNISS